MVEQQQDISKCQQNFLEYCKAFGYGKIEVTIKAGEPVMVSPIKHETKLDVDKFQFQTIM